MTTPSWSRRQIGLGREQGHQAPGSVFPQQIATVYGHPTPIGA